MVFNGRQSTTHLVVSGALLKTLEKPKERLIFTSIRTHNRSRSARWAAAGQKNNVGKRSQQNRSVRNFGKRIGSKDWVCRDETWSKWIQPRLALALHVWVGLGRNRCSWIVPAMLARALRQVINNQLRTDTFKVNQTV